MPKTLQIVDNKVDRSDHGDKVYETGKKLFKFKKVKKQ